jgi:Pyruvate/2-oxoacid:ferredoxin oxidoreductase gamma subunit
MIEISFSGRGGQGVVLASQMPGLAFFKAAGMTFDQVQTIEPGGPHG